MAFAVVRKAVCLLLLGLFMTACSTSHRLASSVPEGRKASFTNSQPGNGGCTLVFGCNIQVLCWDGSEPDPFDGGCPPVPPGGSTQPPAPPACDIAEATVATTPLPRNRSTLGVGEQVQLSSSDGSTWSVSGAGTLDTNSGGTVLFTADENSGTATVTASASGCVATTVTFNVIQPSGLLYVAINGIFHTQGLADIGMQANVYFQPDSVSFQRLAWLEQDAQATASGIYSCWAEQSHHPNTQPQLAQANTIPGSGTPVASDTVVDGDCAGVDQHGNGTLSWVIPESYMVGIGGTQHQFMTLQHAGTASSGTLTVQKGSASRSTTVDSPSSNY